MVRFKDVSVLSVFLLFAEICNFEAITPHFKSVILSNSSTIAYQGADKLQKEYKETPLSTQIF